MDARILIIEDEEDLVRGLALNLEAEGYHVDYALDGRQGLRKALDSPPDIILLDLMLPGMDGLELCRELRQRQLHVPILMLTARGTEVDKVVGLEVGADDYITKPFSLRELLARIRANLRRERQREPVNDVYCTGDVLVDFRHFKVRRGRRDFELTSLEMEILKHLIDCRGQVVTREDLLARIWGENTDYTTRTIDNHILKLRKKIEADPAHPKRILTVYGEGYRFVAE